MADAFVDTDVIIRLLTGDDLQKQREAAALFRAVEAGQLTLIAPDTVIFDVVFVLASPRLYRLSRSQIRAALAPILRPTAFRVQNKQMLVRALDLYASTNLPFGDAVIVATMEGSGAHVLFSYDEHFDQVSGIARRRPGT